MRWLRATKDLSPHTIRAYDGDVTAFGRYLGRRALVEDIDRDRLVTFVEALRDAGLSTPSIRRRVAAIRGFCRWLVASRLLAVDPVIGVTLPAGRRRRLPRVVPGHELDQLLRHLRWAARVAHTPELRIVRARPHHCTTLLGVTLMLTTGMRVHEVVGLDTADVDLPARSIRVLGKGRRERRVFLTHPWLTSLTGIYLQVRGEVCAEHARLLFNSSYGPMTTQAMRVRLRKAAASAGLRTTVTPHMLRHTAATQLIEAGVDIRYIQRLLGHASLATTELYTHVSDPALRRAIVAADILEPLLQR
jgi:integrase/recombinase XerD